MKATGLHVASGGGRHAGQGAPWWSACCADVTTTKSTAKVKAARYHVQPEKGERPRFEKPKAIAVLQLPASSGRIMAVEESSPRLQQV